MRRNRIGTAAASSVCATALLLGAVTLSAQAPPAAAGTPATTLPTYDVAVIRPNSAGTGDVDIWTRDATFQAQNVPFKDLLRSAFRVRRGLISGVPAWAESARYDLNAKIVDPDMAQLRNLTADQRRAMLRTLLEDRFHLKWHYETRTVPTYELVVARSGSKLKEATHSDREGSTSMSNTDLTATEVRLSRLTDILSDQVDRPVVDKTGLSAKYDLHLKWTREETRPSDGGSDAEAPPTLFTALEEQLGLKLVPGKDPVEALVIDQVSAPTEN